MKTISKSYQFIVLFLFMASEQLLSQNLVPTSPSGIINNTQTNTARQGLLVYVMGWVKWIIIIGVVISLCGTAFHFLTGNKDLGKKWGIGCITGILIWFLAPSILAAFGMTLTW